MTRLRSPANSNQEPLPDKAVQTASKNQTLAHQAVLVCALERFRKAEGRYSGKLEVLAPRFVEKIPRDVMNGQPLKYERRGEGGFALYSVGWDQTDDGGSVAGSKDWVWE